MIQGKRISPKMWLLAFAACAGIGLILGLMPGINHQTRAHSQDSWRPTGLLNTARTYIATATLLPNGQVFVAGGQALEDGSGLGNFNATVETELFDSSTETFTSAGFMTGPRAGHTATVLEDGRVLLAGGVDNAGIYVPTAELYDPATGTFLETESMTTARAGHVAVRLEDGRVLVAGGSDGTNFLHSAELYDPETGRFLATGSMQDSRAVFSGVLLHTGKVLVMGGYGASPQQVLNSAEIFDPQAGTFTSTSSLQMGRAGFHQAVRLQSGNVLVVGGVGANGLGLSTAEIYSTEGRFFSPTGTMDTGRQHHSLTLLPNGHVLVVGGWTGVGGVVLDSVEMYDPDTREFSLSEPLSMGRGFHTATLLNNGTVLVLGGSSEASFTSPALAKSETFVCSACLLPPEAPTELVAQDVEHDQGGTVRLRWSPSSSQAIEGYRVYSSTSAGGPYSLLAEVTNPSATTYTHTGLVNGVRHYYILRAFDGNRESENSEEVSARALDNIVPSAPTGLTIEDFPGDDGTALVLTWIPSDSEDIREQRVYRSLTPDSTYTLAATFKERGTTTFVDSGLSSDTTYYYVLSAFDGTQESPLTAEVSGRPQDNRPVASGLSIDLLEDDSAVLTLLGEAPPGESLTYAITVPPQYGQLSGVPPQLTYTPKPNFYGTDSFTYVVNHGTLTSEPATVILNVKSVNDLPVAVADSFTLEEDATAVVLPVLTNDTVAPDIGEMLSITSVVPPDQGGRVKIATDHQSLLYTPMANWSGTETFIYTISDGVPNSEATALVKVSTAAVNDPPSVTPFVLSWEPSPSPGVVEQRVYRGTTSGGPYQLMASLPVAQSNRFTDVNGLEVGATYFYVMRSFDGEKESTNSNEISGVAGQRSVAVVEDSPVSVTLPGYDRDSSTLSYEIGQGPQHGTITGDGPTMVYTPYPNVTGRDRFTYTVSDGELSSETGTIVLTISARNDPPIAIAETINVQENREAPITLRGEDGDPEVTQRLSFVLESLPSLGSLSPIPGGAGIDPSQLPFLLTTPELYYRAPTKAAGTVTFTFRVQDDGGSENGGVDTSSTAPVTITIVEQ